MSLFFLEGDKFKKTSVLCLQRSQQKKKECKLFADINTWRTFGTNYKPLINKLTATQVKQIKEKRGKARERILERLPKIIPYSQGKWRHFI